MTDIRPKQPWRLKILAIACAARDRYLVWLRLQMSDWDDEPTSPGKVVWCPQCLYGLKRQVRVEDCVEHRNEPA